MVRLTDRPDMTLDVYRGRKTTMQEQKKSNNKISVYIFIIFKDKIHDRKSQNFKLFLSGQP